MTLEDDVRAAVDEAARTGSVLDVPTIAAALAESHADARLPQSAIEQMLMEAGVVARVAMRMPGS
jgi:hypothetical protein